MTVHRRAAVRPVRRLAIAAACGALGVLTAAAPSGDGPSAQTGDEGQWVRAAGDYASTRYSALTQITAANVKDLKPAWTFDLGVQRGQEAAPLIVGDTMYVVTAYPNVLYALDLRRPATVRWKYEPKPARAAQGVACCDVVNRGAAYADGLVIFNTLDVHTVAVEAATGREAWRTKLGEIARGETMTSMMVRPSAQSGLPECER
jgi:lanthanide-dependent methanol dehydrogenase